MDNPFRHFNSSPEVIRLAVMMYIRCTSAVHCRNRAAPHLDIAALVADGLDPRVQQVLDIVRVVGNNAVHPGQIDLRDDRATAEMLFGFLNVIAEKTISVPKRIEEVYGALPEDARDAIAKRDANT